MEAQASTSHHHSLKDPHRHQWDTLHEFWMRSFCEVNCKPLMRASDQ